MTSVTPKVTSSSLLIHFPPNLSPQPIHVTITQLLPSTSLLIHATTNRSTARLSDVFVVSMPRGTETLSSRLEGLGGLEDDIDRLARLLCILSWRALLIISKTATAAVFRIWRSCWGCLGWKKRGGWNTLSSSWAGHSVRPRKQLNRLREYLHTGDILNEAALVRARKPDKPKGKCDTRTRRTRHIQMHWTPRTMRLRCVSFASFACSTWP